MDSNAVKIALVFAQNALRDANAYTDTAIAAIINGMQYRGAVDYYADLDNVARKIGYVYTVKYKGDSGDTPDGTEYVWGEYQDTPQWIPLGPDVNGKADKINGGNIGNLVTITEGGNIGDSGKSPNDFYTANDKGVPNGIAGLDQSGCVPSSQLPVSCGISNMELRITTELI